MGIGLVAVIDNFLVGDADFIGSIALLGPAAGFRLVVGAGISAGLEGGWKAVVIFGDSVGLGDRTKVFGRLGFGDLISGFCFRGWSFLGDGVRALTGKGGSRYSGNWLGTWVADVIDLLMVGFFLTVCCFAEAFCSNMEIKEVVGGIGVVSKAWFKLSLELRLLTDPDDFPVKLACLCDAIDDSCCPV